MDNETKEILQLILSKVSSLETEVKEIKRDVSCLKAGQESIKQCIVSNNVAIADIFTQAIESSNSKVSELEKVTKDNLFDIAILKKSKQKPAKSLASL